MSMGYEYYLGVRVIIHVGRFNPAAYIASERNLQPPGHVLKHIWA